MAAPTILSAVKYRTRTTVVVMWTTPPPPLRMVPLCCLILKRKKADWVSAVFKVPPQGSIPEQVDGDKGLFLKHLGSLFEKSACVVPSLSPAYQICSGIR